MCNYSSVSGVGADLFFCFQVLTATFGFIYNHNCSTPSSFSFYWAFHSGFLRNYCALLYGVVPTLSQINSQISAEKKPVTVTAAATEYVWFLFQIYCIKAGRPYTVESALAETGWGFYAENHIFSGQCIFEGWWAAEGGRP